MLNLLTLSILEQCCYSSSSVSAADLLIAFCNVATSLVLLLLMPQSIIVQAQCLTSVTAQQHSFNAGSTHALLQMLLSRPCQIARFMSSWHLQSCVGAREFLAVHPM